MSTSLSDLKLNGKESNCCSAYIYEPDRCSACGEPCQSVEDEKEDSTSMEEKLEALAETI